MFLRKQSWKLIYRSITIINLNIVCTVFATFFVSLHSCLSSSGSIERVFSTFGFIWSKIRNSLGKDKAEKLVRIYRYFQSQKIMNEQGLVFAFLIVVLIVYYNVENKRNNNYIDCFNYTVLQLAYLDSHNLNLN